MTYSQIGHTTLERKKWIPFSFDILDQKPVECSPFYTNLSDKLCLATKQDISSNTLSVPLQLPHNLQDNYHIRHIGKDTSHRKKENSNYMHRNPYYHWKNLASMMIESKGPLH